MKTQGEIEAAICEGVSRFEQEHMGRGPKEAPQLDPVELARWHSRPSPTNMERLTPTQTIGSGGVRPSLSEIKPESTSKTSPNRDRSVGTSKAGKRKKPRETRGF
jgi:hypothetical protein